MVVRLRKFDLLRLLSDEMSVLLHLIEIGLGESMPSTISMERRAIAQELQSDQTNAAEVHGPVYGGLY